MDDLVEGLVERRAERWREYTAAGALGERGERVLAADVAPGLVDDRHHEHGINHRVGQLRGFGRRAGNRLWLVVSPPSVTITRTLRPVPVFDIARSEKNRIVKRRSRFARSTRSECSIDGNVARETVLLDDLPIEAVERDGIQPDCLPATARAETASPSRFRTSDPWRSTRCCRSAPRPITADRSAVRRPRSVCGTPLSRTAKSAFFERSDERAGRHLSQWREYAPVAHRCGKTASSC